MNPINNGPQPSRSKVWLLAGGLLLFFIGMGTCRAWVEYAGRRELSRAENELNQQHLDRALIHLENGLRFRPDDAHLHLLAGRAYRQFEEYEKAEEHLDRCAKQGNSEELGLERLLLRACRGDIDGVQHLLLPYIQERKPQSALIFEAMAVGHLRRSNVTAARDAIDSWLELEGDNPRAHLLRAHMWCVFHSTVEGRVSYERAVELDPENSEARSGLAETLIELGYPQLAEPHLEFLRETRPRDITVLLRLSVCHRERGAYRNAEEDIALALELDPENETALIYKGMIAFEQKQYEEAIQAFRKVLEVDALNLEAYKQLRQCYLELGDRERANENGPLLQELERSAKREYELLKVLLPRAPRDPGLCSELGEIYYRRGKMSKAIGWFNRALNTNPNHTPTLRLMNEYRIRLGIVHPATNSQSGTGEP